MSLTIRSARPEDSALVFALVRELADYEKLATTMVATEEQIAAALFSAQPRLFCDIGEWNGEPVGFAVWFLNFSTFSGRHGIYLEDIFVRSAHRRRGIGKALLKQLARHCLEKGYGRLEWAVLDWNGPAIEFYRSLGVEIMSKWKICQLNGQALRDFAGAKDGS